MTTRIGFALSLVGLVATTALSGCNDTPTTAVVTNVTGDATVRKVWWSTTLFADPLAPGARSAAERTTPGDDFAYALIAPGAPPDPGPAALIALRSRQKLSVARGGRLEIDVSDAAFAGNCATAAPLDDETARLITERIFPGDFAGAIYDPTTCETTPTTGDGGAPGDAAPQAGSDGAGPD